MIKLQDYTPDVYYKESRDFQFIGRLYDLVLNYSKTNADLLYYLPFSQNSDDKFIELLSYTLGFKPKHNYTAKHLRAVCSVFSEILRNKGSIKAMLLTCGAIFNSEGIEHEVDYELTDDNKKLILYLPPELRDTTLINDIFDYILPAGMAVNLIKLVQANKDATTKINIGSRFRLFDRGDATAPNKGAVLYDGNVMSKLPQYVNDDETDRVAGVMNVNDAAGAFAEDKLGILANGGVYIPKDDENDGD